MFAGPEQIEFDTKVLVLPSLREAGVAPPMDSISQVVTHAKPGEWVARGQPLVTHRLHSFVNESRPAAWQFWKDDLKRVEEFTVVSPVFGLLLANLENSVSREMTPGTYGYQSHMIWEGSWSTSVLLLPKAEPPWDSRDLRTTYLQIMSWIANNWRLNIHNPGGGSNEYVWRRLGDWIEAAGTSSMPHAVGSDDAFENGDWLSGAESCSKVLKHQDGLDNLHWREHEIFDYRDRRGENLKNWVDTCRTNDPSLYAKLAFLNDEGLWQV